MSNNSLCFDAESAMAYRAESLEPAHSLEIVCKGHVMAVLRGRDLESLQSRANTMATCMGWKGCEYRERLA